VVGTVPILLDGTDLPPCDRLVGGAILTPGRRTVTAMLTVVGLSRAPTFTNYHRVLNRNRWSSREVARRLLTSLIAAFMPTGPVVIGLDDTLERRWGARIKARGIYRDPIRSSHGHFVKASGLRWLSFMLLTPIPWADRVWALPFLTVLAPSERFSRERRRRHKALTDWARQGLLQIARWLPDRRLIAVADTSYAAIELLSAVHERVCMITRLRLDARLFAPPAPRKPGTIGRPRIVGERLPTLAECLADPNTPWRRLRVDRWCGGGERLVEIISGTAIWHHPGKHVAIRYVLVRDAAGAFRPQAFLCTDLDADPLDILRWFVRRWSTEVTFAEVRRHLGVETLVGQGDCAHHAGSARPVLPRGPMDRSRRCSLVHPATARDLVRETDDHVQRCSRRGAPVAVGQRAFVSVSETAQYR
jgi:DDE superfamily endonuclease